MTFEELKNLQISNVIASTSEYQALVKQCLSIVAKSTAKDNEIAMWIAGAIEDLLRQGIDVSNNLSNGLIQGAIVMFVKGHFGLVEEHDKRLALECYKQICTNLSLSQKFLLEDIEE